ncbi:MAG: CoA transferase [Sterolibacterium sp.]|nr:CoA transferase [Sterolibacterium sp.]
MGKPLAGVRILDFSQLLPGPLCTQHLADLGAEVLKIENRRGGDAARAAPEGAVSMLFLLANRNKRSLAVDLRQAEGQALVHQLVKEADVVVEGFRPGAMARLNMDYATLAALNPKLVYCSITGYGQSGPLADKGGHDINYQSLAGILDQNGVAGGPPVVSNFQAADLAGGVLSAAMGILAALFDAQRSGQGRHIDVAMTDCALAHNIMPLAAMESYGAGRPMARGEDYTSGRLPCYGVYATRDGRHLALGAIEPQFWANFCTAAGQPELIMQGWAMGAEAAAAKTAIAALVARRTLAEWSALLDNIDGCATPVLRLDEVIAHENTRARGMIVEGRRPEGDGETYRQYAFPIKMTDFEFVVECQPPLLGEHNIEVLTALGHDAAAIAALREQGVV